MNVLYLAVGGYEKVLSRLRAERGSVVANPDLNAISAVRETLADETESVKLVYHFRSDSGDKYIRLSIPGLYKFFQEMY